MILADSSVLIEFYRLKGDPEVQEAVAAAIARDLLAARSLLGGEPSLGQILAWAAVLRQLRDAPG